MWTNPLYEVQLENIYYKSRYFLCTESIFYGNNLVIILRYSLPLYDPSIGTCTNEIIIHMEFHLNYSQTYMALSSAVDELILNYIIFYCRLEYFPLRRHQQVINGGHVKVTHIHRVTVQRNSNVRLTYKCQFPSP